MPAPLLAPASQLQGWIFTDLLTDPGVHANRCDGHCAADDTRLAWHRQACCGSAQGPPGGRGRST